MGRTSNARTAALSRKSFHNRRPQNPSSVFLYVCILYVSMCTEIQFGIIKAQLHQTDGVPCVREVVTIRILGLAMLEYPKLKDPTTSDIINFLRFRQKFTAGGTRLAASRR